MNKIKGKSNLYGGVFLMVSGAVLSKPSMDNFNLFTGNNPIPFVLSLALILIGIIELIFFSMKKE